MTITSRSEAFTKTVSMQRKITFLFECLLIFFSFLYCNIYKNEVIL